MSQTLTTPPSCKPITIKHRCPAKYKQISLDKLKQIVKNSETLAKILEQIGYSSRQSHTGEGLINYLNKKNIDISHLHLPSQQIPIQQLHTKNSIQLQQLQKLFLQQQDQMHLLYQSTKQVPDKQLKEIINLQQKSQELLEFTLNQVESKNNNYKTYVDSQPLSKMLTINSKCPSHRLRTKLIKEKILINQCIICGMDPIWLGKSINLELDHINGIHSDNRLENLRILCPMCHRLTPTYGGKNKVYQKKIKDITLKNAHACLDCAKEIPNESKYCVDCQTLHNKWVETRPDLNQLIKDLIGTSYLKTGEKYGVSDKVIRNWIKTYDQDPPSDKQLELYRKAKLKDVKIQLTPTYENENKIKDITLKKNIKNCSICGKEDIWGDKFCADCAKIHAPQSVRHVERPSIDQLMTDVINTNYMKTAEKYGVSDKAIRKWFIAYKRVPPNYEELNTLRKVKEKLKNINIKLKTQINIIQSNCIINVAAGT